MGEKTMVVFRQKAFLTNDAAVCEEFTSLPALTVVLIGFTLFCLLIVSAQESYETKMETIDLYQTAEFITSKLLSPDSNLIKENGIINYPFLRNQEGINYLKSLQSTYQPLGINFSVLISFNEIHRFFPSEPPSTVNDRIAISKPIAFFLNDVQTVAGTITVILWHN